MKIAKKSSIVLSFVVVHYKAYKELIACIASIQKFRTKISSEIIVVDNDEKPVIQLELKKSFPTVRYIKSPKNGGYGYGLNIGTQKAKGEYLFFLNEDTKLLSDVGTVLVDFLEKHKGAIVAPALFDASKKIYPLQGAKELGVIEGIVAISFFNKIFPNNPISRHYFLKDVNKVNAYEVDVVPGTAFMLEKKMFDELGGFDEHFFLFFEEVDLCKRAKAHGATIFIEPRAKVMHLWGKSTAYDMQQTSHEFQKSRMYYFCKHYGFLAMCLVELFARGRRIKGNGV